MATGGTNAFLGLRPKIAPHLIEDPFSSDCNNVLLVNGHLAALNGHLEDRTFVSPPKTLWKWDDQNYWLSFDDAYSIARPVNLAVNRLYATGPISPIVIVLGDGPDSAFNGVGPYPASGSVWSLGVPAALNPPTASITNLTPDVDRDYTALDLETRYYAFTQVNAWGEESAFSPVSLRVDCYDDSLLTLAATITNGTGYKPITSIRIYRTNTGSQSTGWQFVKEVAAANVASITDDVLSSALSEVAETADWATPPVDLQNLVLVGESFYAGTSVDNSSGRREVCLSVPLVPYAWPLRYRFPIQDEPVALAVNGLDLVVLTKGRPVVFVGNSPDAVQPIRLSEYQPCLSAASVAVHRGMVVYAGADGLIGVSSSQGFANLTEDIMTREQWQALDPASMQIQPWEGFLWISSDVAGILLDLREKTYSPISLRYNTAFYDGYEDVLYFTGVGVYGGTLFRFAEAGAMPYTWTSKHYLMPAGSFAWARVNALTYTSATFALYVDGRKVYQRRVTSKEPFRLPAARGRVVWFTVTGTDTVRSASIATSVGELVL